MTRGRSASRSSRRVAVPTRRGDTAWLALSILAAMSATMLGGCFAPASVMHPAARTVENALETRKARDTDPEAYSTYFEDSSLATQLADDAAQSGDTTPPIPPWDTPYVSEAGTSTADVVVVWKAYSDRPGWPKATLFNLKVSAGHWVIVDAESVEGTVPLPAVAE